MFEFRRVLSAFYFLEGYLIVYFVKNAEGADAALWPGISAKGIGINYILTVICENGDTYFISWL